MRIQTGVLALAASGRRRLETMGTKPNQKTGWAKCMIGVSARPRTVLNSTIAARESDQFALLLAAGLDQRAGLEALPAAERQKGVPKFSRRVAEPGAAAEHIHTLFTIHVGGPRSDELTHAEAAN